MDVFLIDGQNYYLYDELLSRINSAKSYCPLYKTDNLYDYFYNFVLALVSNRDLVLLDSDISISEINSINVSSTNVFVEIEKRKFHSMNELLLKLQETKSEITIFTSGTTGQPQKVIHSVLSLTRSVRISDRYKDQIWAFAFNPTHMAGLQVFFQTFMNLNTIVNVFNKDRTVVYDVINQYAITHISATPTFYRLLLPIENQYFSVKRITLGGEKSNQKLYDSILRIFPNSKINNIYASTEAGSLFVASGENFKIPIEMMDKFKVENDELLIHQSLLGKSESFSFQKEYYCTGDIIEWVDKNEGIFRFKRRKNELVNVGGYKVNPDEVESLILQIDGVMQALVYSKSNSILGNILCADIELEDSCNLTEVKIRKILTSDLQDYKIPRIIKIVDSFSLTRTGKLKRL